MPWEKAAEMKDELKMNGDYESSVRRSFISLSHMYTDFIHATQGMGNCGGLSTV